MNRKQSDKSIVANFGALSVKPMEGEEDSSKTQLLPIARVGAGVIGATQRTLTEMREEHNQLLALVAAGGGLELDPSLIDPSPFSDRLPDDNEADFDNLKKLIFEEGQKVPIQVRTHLNAPGRYQIIYGHRRWRAARDLGVKVKAILVELSDHELVVAQGIENAARQDLSWIERALFAWRMDQANIKARDIRAALSIDDPELARLRLVCRWLPAEVIIAIGRAPTIGRPRWVDLATIVSKEPGTLQYIYETLSDDKVLALSSDDRFRKVLNAVKPPNPNQPIDLDLKSPKGDVVGKASFGGREIKLVIEHFRAEEFKAFLRVDLPHLMERFFTQQDKE